MIDFVPPSSIPAMRMSWSFQPSRPAFMLSSLIRRRGAKLAPKRGGVCAAARSEEHTSELQSLMRISYAVFCLKKNKNTITYIKTHHLFKCHIEKNTTNLCKPAIIQDAN